ncbi:hypothetical protein NHQ30_004616 [Ciborinia camelliae]|nr:hypothetical protein NHQ30_004616 [Ciborinia camelliae]
MYGDPINEIEINKKMAPKSNANRRNRATRRLARLADVPPHPLINYVGSSAALCIDLDFCMFRSPTEEKNIFDALVETLPKYANETNIIHLRMIFKSPHKDVECANRHEILTRVVEKINDFPHIKEIAFSLVLDRFDWKQLKCASSIYHLNFIDWTFDLNMKNREIEHVLVNSRLDRKLRAAEAKILEQAM